jgi:hypothetical protein
MNRRFCIIDFFLCFALFLQTEDSKAQLKFYEDSFHGGVTAGGYSPGTGLAGSGAFSIHIAPGSSIRKAYLFAGRQGQVSPVTIGLNGSNILFNSSTVLTSFYSPYGGIASVHAVEVTSFLNATTLNYTLYYPGGGSPSNTYTDFYLYVAYDNASMDIVNSAIFVNTHDFDTIVQYNLNVINPIINNTNIGLSLSCGYMCSYGDGDYVYVNGTYIGKLGGRDINTTASCGGTMGSFYYEMNTLFGLSDDLPDLAMDSSDALSNIQTVLPSTTNSVYVLFNDDTSGNPDNSTWLAVLAYGNSTTGINNFNQSNLEIFPNLVKDKFTINYKDNTLSEIILFDIASRKILQQKFTNSITLNTSQLSKGIYIYELRNKTAVIKKGKLVKD